MPALDKVPKVTKPALDIPMPPSAGDNVAVLAEAEASARAEAGTNPVVFLDITVGREYAGRIAIGQCSVQSPVCSQ